MSRISKEKEAEIKKLEKDIKEDKSLWQKIVAMPEKDSKYRKKLKQLIKRHKPKKVKSKSKLRKLADKLFWGLEPKK